MKTIAKIAAFAGLSAAASAQASLPMLYEEAFARAEEKLIIATPIAGIQNSLWFDYRIDVLEAQKELARDLRNVTDIEDQRDAWEEYGVELRHERVDYVKAMARKGYRQGTVTVGG